MLLDRLRDLLLDLATGRVIGSRSVGHRIAHKRDQPRFWATAVRLKT